MEDPLVAFIRRAKKAVAAALGVLVPVALIYLGPDDPVLTAVLGVLAEFGIVYWTPRNRTG